MSSTQDAPKYSVLILGSSQAGKSALIEHIRSYADPGYAINESLLGDGTTSKTDATTPFLVESNLPTYKAYRKDTGLTFELQNLATLYKDADDYRDAVLSRSDNVGMRLVPQDTTGPSGSMEFRLLDTPGFNGTHDRDSEHAASIVNEVISTRSFNLIVFVISSKNPLTEEKQLALEYFAYILRGLHSRIVFLYTHVNYADTHPSNTTHHLDMSVRSKTISKIFRRHDGESVFDEFNIAEYPCLNIDLTTRNRPIVQCMIRNTIREMLTMATAPPAILDTSTSNIERIRAVTYPTELGQEQRNTLEATLRRNIAKPKYSVLIMGKTQAGKSTLIEHIKTYANMSYAIDQSLLGDVNLSATESTQPFHVESNLPVYEVYRKDTGEVIDLGDLPSKFDDEEDYRDILFLRERDVGLRQAPQDPSNPSDGIEFRFFDSIGLNNADENESNHAAIIIDRLIHIQTFNLIIITESYKNLLTQEQQLDLEYFADVFKGLHSKIMFLHTHVDHTNIHPTNTTHHLNMKMKNKALSELFRRHDNEVSFDENNFKEYPSLSIDLVSKKRPVITCLILNTIREILMIATQPAVTFDTSIQNIERIRAIPYPTHMTDEQFKQAKARFRADEDKFEEEQSEVQVVEQTGVQDMWQAEVPTEVPTEVQVVEDTGQTEMQSNMQVTEQTKKLVKAACRCLYLISILCLYLIGFPCFLFIFARRRRRASENEVAGGPGCDQSHYEAYHGGIPPLVPIAPIGDLDEVIVEDKDIPGAPNNNNNIPGGPSGGDIVPGGPSDGGYYPGGPTDGNNIPGGPTDGGYYPGGPTDGNNIPGGPSGNGGVVPPVGGGSHSHLPGIIGGVVGGAIIGGAIASHKKKDEKETVTHGHVAPVPVPGGPNSDNSTNQPSRSGGVFPVGGFSSSSTETSHHHGKEILIGGAVVGALIGGAIIAGKRNDSSDSLPKTTRTTVKTTVTTTKNGGKIFTTTGSGGRTIVTERTETGAARHIITGVVPGHTIVRTITQRTESGDEILVPVDEPEGDCRVVVTERSENGQIRYIIGDIIAGAVAGGIVRTIHSSSTSSSVDGGSTTISSSARIVTERSSTGEVRFIIVGGFSGNAIRVITERSSTGETRLIPTNEESGELRHVISERSESGEIRYIIGSVITSNTVTRVIMGPRIVSERTLSGEIRYVIIDQYNGNSIRTKFESNEETGEFVHTPVKEPEGELRYVTEERTEFGEIRKVIGAVINGDLSTTTLTVSGGVATEGCKISMHSTKTVDSDKGSGSHSRSDESCASSTVLVLGKTQAGKSTFIEFVKNYANQQYSINESLLGTGFSSKTRMPVEFKVKTDLPAYEVFDATGTRIDIGSLADQYQDPDDYLDALNNRNTTLKLVSHDSASSLPPDFEIIFLDTPGVEDTNSRDAEHAKSIIEAMTKMQSLNLIIIIINCEETASKVHQLAFNYYAKVIHTFQGHHSNIVFLYTHVEYEKCHHSNPDHLSVMERQHKAFSQLFRCKGSYNHEDVCKAAVEPYPMYNIDFDKRQRPVTKCMRLMTLREILTHVVNSPAVSLDTSVSNMKRIRAIPQPDEANQAQRKKFLEMTPVIMEQEQGPQEPIIESVVPRGCPMPLEVNSNGARNEGRGTDLVGCGRDNSDWEHYFS